MPVRYDYRTCSDCHAVFTVQIDADGQPVTEAERVRCYECEPPVAESAHIQLLRRQMRMQGRKHGAPWKREALMLADAADEMREAGDCDEAQTIRR